MIKVKWPKVLYYNNLDQPPLIEWIDLGNGTMFRIFAFFSHGGRKRPRRGLVIGIERVGSFFFNIDSEYKKMAWEYVSEKLRIPEADARSLADWINAQLDFDVPQQGHYVKEYITEVEPYGLIGERPLMPLIPEIIN